MSNKSPARETIQAKSDRLHVARVMAERFIDAGGDLNSTEAFEIGVELSLASDDLSSEFGHTTLKGI